MTIETFDPKQPVHLTPLARRHFISRLLNSREETGVRISIKTSGCSGYQYTLDFVHQASPEDISVELDDQFKLFVDKKALPIIQGTVVDLKKEGLNETIEFQNPNVKSKCGCGESFSITH